jgi:AraC family transcriptional activator of tynA and feaB
MSQVFSTEQVATSDRIDAWQWYARRFCGDCHFRFPNLRTFHGSIDSKKVGGLDLSLFSSTSLGFTKLPGGSRLPENRFYTVITQLEGIRSYSQNHTAVFLNPGDTTVIDAAVPWSSECVGHCARLYLRVPGWLMQDRLRTMAVPIGRRICGSSPLGATLFHLADSIYRNASMLAEEEGTAMLDAYFDILSACVGHHETRFESAHDRADLAAQIKDFIEAHLAETNLGPSEIAAAVGISVRHLHRVFARKGHTVGDWIRERRLEQCRNDLADARLRERSITDIAFGWGFSESAHFSRSFKKVFGVCPREYRSQVWAGPWKDQHGARQTSYPLAATVRHSRLN